MKHTIQTLITVTALSFGVMSNAFADADDLHEMETMAKTFGLISFEEAKTKALAAKPGVIDDAEFESKKFEKGWNYEFEIVDADGVEWDVDIDAKTGKVTKMSKDWF